MARYLYKLGTLIPSKSIPSGREHLGSSVDWALFVNEEKPMTGCSVLSPGDIF